MQFINKAIKTSLCGVFVLWASSAWAAQKVALIIGNSQYQTVEDRLKNPVNDAKAIEKRLKELGFTTQLLANANLDDMLEAINRARSNVDKDGTVLFYYAGHGIQVDGKNYLVPVDARMANRDRVPRETVQVKEVIEKLNDSSAAARIVIIDACRNDPFPKSYRSGTRGLTRETLPVSKGLMVMYAASEGEVAEDGNGANGAFTAALLQSLSQPNIKLPELMDDVATQVQQKTQNKQNPYSEGRGLSKLVLNSQAQVAAKPQVVERIVEAKTNSAMAKKDNRCLVGKWGLVSNNEEFPAPAIINISLISKDIIVLQAEDGGRTMSTAYRLDGKLHSAEEMFKLLPHDAMDGIDIEQLKTVFYNGQWNDECGFKVLASMNGVVVSDTSYKVSGQVMAMDIALKDPRDGSEIQVSNLYKRLTD